MLRVAASASSAATPLDRVRRDGGDGRRRPLADRLRRFPVVVLTGARQTGKTTLVQSFAGAAGRRFLTLDSLAVLDRARRQPEVLVQEGPRLTLDEVHTGTEAAQLTPRTIAVPVGAVL